MIYNIEGFKIPSPLRATCNDARVAVANVKIISLAMRVQRHFAGMSVQVSDVAALALSHAIWCGLPMYVRELTEQDFDHGLLVGEAMMSALKRIDYKG